MVLLVDDFFFFKQKTAYEMRISDWSSDVCSSDLVVKAARDNNCSMRIGVNAGSLEKELLERYGEPCPEAMVESALNHAPILEDADFFEFKLSCKASDALLAVAPSTPLADTADYPPHPSIPQAHRLRVGNTTFSFRLG